MRTLFGALVILAAGPALAEEHVLHSFERVTLTERFYSEGADYGDINRDGHMDIVSGPYWYAGPDWKQTTEIYPAQSFEILAYSENFFAWVDDVDGDEWPDVVVGPHPGKEAVWYRNPQGEAKLWDRFVALGTRALKSWRCASGTRECDQAT